MGSVRARSKEAGSGEEGEHLTSSRFAATTSSSPLTSESRRRVPAWTWILFGAAALLTLTLLGLGYSSKTTANYRHDSFITVQGTQFLHKCRPFYIAGFNVDNLAEAMLAWSPSRAGAAGTAVGAAAIVNVLNQAAAAGLNTVRTWAHTTNPKQPFQVSPGAYDENAFQALDLVIAEAEKKGLRVILSLVDNWKYEGGVDEFVDWAKTVPARDKKYPVATGGDGDVNDMEWSEDRKQYEALRKVLFFTDAGVKTLYRNHIRAILERVNTVSGKVYREDPTIMAFDLLNEPRCSVSYTPDCTKLVEQWVYEMATHLKSLDQNHLVTIGAEGFWGVHDKMQIANPGAAEGSDWAAKAGQDFVHHHNMPVVDFATMHLWPDNWLTKNTSFVAEWIHKHIEDSTKVLKKPVLLEEFGKKLSAATSQAVASERDPGFRTVYEESEISTASGSALAGTLFWRWGFNAWDVTNVGEYGVTPEASTFRVVRGHAQRLKAFRNTAPALATCTAECWVGTSALGINRCEQQPGVCLEHASAASLAVRRDAQAGRLQSAGVEAFGSHAECCLPGLGAFAEGCATTVV
ncbi:hypothetical protein ACKKBG_A25440 [Auxenochlorella protothecoides x Auxenochlorella symbiontica]